MIIQEKHFEHLKRTTRVSIKDNNVTSGRYWFLVDDDGLVTVGYGSSGDVIEVKAVLLMCHEEVLKSLNKLEKAMIEAKVYWEETVK